MALLMFCPCPSLNTSKRRKFSFCFSYPQLCMWVSWTMFYVDEERTTRIFVSYQLQMTENSSNWMEHKNTSNHMESPQWRSTGHLIRGSTWYLKTQVFSLCFSRLEWSSPQAATQGCFRFKFKHNSKHRNDYQYNPLPSCPLCFFLGPMELRSVIPTQNMGQMGAIGPGSMLELCR